MRRDLLFVCCTLCAGAALVASSAASNAQAPAQAPVQKPNGTVDQKSDNVPLSKKLDENKGVLKPPSGIDPEIHQNPPANTGDKMPVIVPPGEPGGDQSVQPK
jgi:hypothetical protein